MSISNMSVVPEMVCVEYKEEMYSRGIFHGDNPFKFVYPMFMAQLILISLVSRAVYFVLRPLRQPKFVCNVLAGIILGPSVLGRNKAFMETFFPEHEKILFNTIVVLGTTYFIFITAVKMDTSLLVKTARSAWTIGLLGFIIPFVYNFAAIAILRKSIMANPSLPSAIPVAGGLSVSYFSVIVRAMEEHDLLTSELGQLAMSSSMLSETIGWCFYGVILVMRQQTTIDGIQALISTVLLVIFAIYVIRPILKLIIRKTPAGKPVSETYIVMIIIGAMFMALLTDFVGGLTLPGALLMGLIVPDGPPLASTLVEKSELIMMEFFVPFFYIQIGYYTDVNAIKDMSSFALGLLLVAIGYLAKMSVTLIASLRFNIRLRNAILLGCVMNVKGILDAVNYQRWLVRKIIGKQTYAAFLLGNISITAIVSPLVEIFYKRYIRLHEFHSDKEQKRSLQLASESEELRVLCCIHNEDNVRSIINLIEATNPSKRSPVSIYTIHLIELVGRAAPLLAPYKKHKDRYDPHNSEHIVHAFTNYSMNSRGPVSIQTFTMLAPYNIMDNMITNFVQDKNVSLVLVPFLGNQETNPNKRNQARKLFTKLQEYAPCTVGILVDRGLQSAKGDDNFSYKVVVVFLGGTDDREALALAIRMSANPNVSIKLVRIHLKKQGDATPETDKELDDLLVKEFKDRNADNACVSYREAMVNDSLEMMDQLRSIENHYDLVIVGKRPSMPTGYKEQMAEWVEYEELGLIGDFLAYADFCGGMMSLLVMQHHGQVQADFCSLSIKGNYNGDHVISC